MAPQPSGPAPSSDGKLLKITMFIKKLPSVSDEFFHAYWANNHVAPALKNEKFRSMVVRYVQQHISPADREQAKVFGMPVPQYDGIAEIWVRSLQDWLDAVTDPDFAAANEGDDKNFIRQPMEVIFGYDHLICEQPGAPAVGHDGKKISSSL